MKSLIVQTFTTLHNLSGLEKNRLYKIVRLGFGMNPPRSGAGALLSKYTLA